MLLIGSSSGSCHWSVVRCEVYIFWTSFYGPYATLSSIYFDSHNPNQIGPLEAHIRILILQCYISFHPIFMSQAAPVIGKSENRSKHSGGTAAMSPPWFGRRDISNHVSPWQYHRDAVTIACPILCKHMYIIFNHNWMALPYPTYQHTLQHQRLILQ